MPAFKDYLIQTPRQLLERLGDISQEIANLHDEIAFTKSTELQTKQQAWGESTETSVTGRERVASFHAVNQTISVLDLEARLHARTEEKYYLIRVLDFVKELNPYA